MEGGHELWAGPETIRPDSCYDGDDADGQGDGQLFAEEQDGQDGGDHGHCAAHGGGAANADHADGGVVEKAASHEGDETDEGESGQGGGGQLKEGSGIDDQRDQGDEDEARQDGKECRGLGADAGDAESDEYRAKRPTEGGDEGESDTECGVGHICRVADWLAGHRQAGVAQH